MWIQLGDGEMLNSDNILSVKPEIKKLNDKYATYSISILFAGYYRTLKFDKEKEYSNTLAQIYQLLSPNKLA